MHGERLAGLNRKAAYLFQQDPLMPWCRAIDNIAAGPLRHGATKAEALSSARDGLVRDVDDLKPVIESIEWLSAEDRKKIFEDNCRRVYSRAFPKK